MPTELRHPAMPPTGCTGAGGEQQPAIEGAGAVDAPASLGMCLDYVTTEATATSPTQVAGGGLNQARPHDKRHVATLRAAGDAVTRGRSRAVGSTRQVHPQAPGAIGGSAVPYGVRFERKSAPGSSGRAASTRASLPAAVPPTRPPAVPRPVGEGHGDPRKDQVARLLWILSTGLGEPLCGLGRQAGRCLSPLLTRGFPLLPACWRSWCARVRGGGRGRGRAANGGAALCT